MNRETLDTKTQEFFNKVLNKDVNTLNEDDCAFLKARQDYLTEEELEKYSFIFEEKEEVIDDVTTEQPIEIKEEKVKKVRKPKKQN